MSAVNGTIKPTLGLCFCPGLEKNGRSLTKWMNVGYARCSSFSFYHPSETSLASVTAAAGCCLQSTGSDSLHSLTYFPCSYPCPVFHPVSNENFSRVFGFNFPPVLSIHISLSHQHYPPWLLELSLRLGGWKVPQYSSAKTGAERGSSPAAGVLRTTGDAWNCLPIEPSVHCPHGDCCSINHILGCIRFTLEQNNGS